VASETKQHKTDEKTKVKQNVEDEREVVELESGNYNLNDYSLMGGYEMYVEGEGDFKLNVSDMHDPMIETKLSDADHYCYHGSVCSLRLILSEEMNITIGNGIKKAIFKPVKKFELKYDSMNAGTYVVGQDILPGKYRLTSKFPSSFGIVRIIHTNDDSISEGLLVHPETKVELKANNINTDIMKTEAEIIVEKNDVIISEVNSFEIEKLE